MNNELIPARDEEALNKVADKHQCEIDEITVSGQPGNYRVVVTVDSDEALSLDRLARLSEEFGEFAEQWGAAKDIIHLEVTSRGVGAPLTRLAHYRRAQGRKLAITCESHTTVDCPKSVRLVSCTTDKIVVLWREKKTYKHCVLPLSEIASARVEVEFKPVSEAELKAMREVIAPEASS